MKKLTIEFASDEALQHFAAWLCESGEQDYWEYMKCREEEEDGDITAKFHYDGAFGPDNTIRTTCGRISGPYVEEEG